MPSIVSRLLASTTALMGRPCTCTRVPISIHLHSHSANVAGSENAASVAASPCSAEHSGHVTRAILPAAYHGQPVTRSHPSPASSESGRVSVKLAASRREAGPATAAARVVLPAPAGTDRPYSAAGGLFEAEPCHRRWSRFPVSPSAGGASRLDSRQKGPLPLQQPERFALALGDGQHIAPDATKPDGITGAAGRVATATAFTAARSARLRCCPRPWRRPRGDRHGASCGACRCPAADLVLIPCRASVADLHAIGSSLDVCRVADVPAYVVLNAVPVHGGLADQARAAIVQHGAAVAPAMLCQPTAHVHAFTVGLSVMEH